MPPLSFLPTLALKRPLGPARRVTLWGLTVSGLTLSSLALGGCKDLTGDPGLPAGVPNPTFYNTPDGAVGMRNAAVLEFENALPQYLVDAGLLTDELEDVSTGASAGVLLQNRGVSDPLDERILPESNNILTATGGSVDYGNLQQVREFGNQAIGALATYDSGATVLRGELYAMEGYAEILLAEFFCNGVPLSTLDYGKDFTYDTSRTADYVYGDAISKFNTALTLGLAAHNDSLTNFARVGLGRAWLNRGVWASAAAAVAAVPTTFSYTVPTAWTSTTQSNINNYNILTFARAATVSDTEGMNGLPFLGNAVAGDPRTAVDTVNTARVRPDSTDSLPGTFPAKYSAALTTGYAPVTLASGIEARLIQAEAAWHGVATGTGDWLAQLNALRTTAISPKLSTLTDPGTPAAQVRLLFQERAYWLFVTGHRQGDLRRLLHFYNAYFKSQAAVYPTGPYTAPGQGTYGADVTVPIPPTEYANPLFHGCLDRQP